MTLSSLCLGLLYFSTARQQPSDSSSTKIINVDNKYMYEGYNSDFGPLTLNHVHNFVKEVDALLAKHTKVVHHCSPGHKTEANGAFLIGSFLIISKGWPISKIEDALGAAYLHSLKPFRDAGVGPDDFPLTVIDCLKGIERALALNWYN